MLGLIDVDPAFCCAASDPHSTIVVLPLIGRAGVSGLSRALRKASEDWNAVIQVGSDGKARVPAVLVAAVLLRGSGDGRSRRCVPVHTHR